MQFTSLKWFTLLHEVFTTKTIIVQELPLEFLMKSLLANETSNELTRIRDDILESFLLFVLTTKDSYIQQK